MCYKTVRERFFLSQEKKTKKCSNELYLLNIKLSNTKKLHFKHQVFVSQTHVK